MGDGVEYGSKYGTACSYLPSHPHDGKYQMQRSSFSTGPAVPLSNASWPQGAIELSVMPLQRIANPIYQPRPRAFAASHTLQKPTGTLPCHSFPAPFSTKNHQARGLWDIAAPDRRP